MPPKLFQHRVNTVDALEKVPHAYGIEIDLRSDGDRVIVTHDPYTDGETIEAFFPRIGPRSVIFNVKCEGVEERVLAVAKRCGIEDFFFLDCSVPAMAKLVRAGETRLAVRYSELEPIELALAWRGRAQWVWADCFRAFPGDAAAWESLRDFQLCVVSPELQGHSVEHAGVLRASLVGRRFAAVCTKKPETWRDGAEASSPAGAAT
jgi:hypothetical protein